jgi:hypothetical protein
MANTKKTNMKKVVTTRANYELSKQGVAPAAPVNVTAKPIKVSSGGSKSSSTKTTLAKRANQSIVARGGKAVKTYTKKAK